MCDDVQEKKNINDNLHLGRPVKYYKNRPSAEISEFAQCTVNVAGNFYKNVDFLNGKPQINKKKQNRDEKR